MLRRVQRCQSRRLAFTLLVAIAAPACAEGWNAAIEPAAPVAAWREISGGGTATHDSWALYSSSTFAPFGDLASDGFRARIGSGYGQYRYTIPSRFYYTCPKPALICAAVPVKGRVTFGDILAGYQLSIGQLTIKGFAGVASDNQMLSVHDSFNLGEGSEIGFKGVVETWLNITPKIWASLDGSWTAAHQGYATRLRLGYRILEGVSLGLEESVSGNVAGQRLGSGAFVRYEWSWGEAALSGGLSAEHADTRDVSRDRPWGALSVSVRY